VLTHVVWDWNGTLFDDLHTCVAVANQLLGEFDLPGLTGVADYHAKFRFPIIEYYADLGFDTSPAGNFEGAARRYMELYGAASVQCRLHEGAMEALGAVHEAGVRQVVISASQQDNLRVQLAPFGLDAYLDGIHGIDDIYAASKESLARRWLPSCPSPDRAQACAAISHVSEKPAGATPSPRISRAHALT
jgi:phosphoglycolate phosphatase